MLSQVNSHPRDRRISFVDSTHTYTLDNSSKDVTSCTTFISAFFKPFKADEAITNIMKSEKYLNDPTYKYFNKSSDQIKKEWDNSRDAGTFLHGQIEDFLNGVEVKNESKEYNYFQTFSKDHSHLSPYRTEWKIYTEILRISGAIDAVYKDSSDGTFTLFDWKRSPVSYDNFQNAKEPIQHLSDNTFNKYSLQLNLYRQILEDRYDVKVKDMFIIELHPDNESYKKIKVPRMESEMSHLFTIRAKNLKQLGYKNPELDNYKDGCVPSSSSSSSVTTNRGKRWTDEEDIQLLQSIKDGKTIQNIAIAHGRTENGISQRILRNATLHLEKHTMEEVCEWFKLDHEKLKQHIKKVKGDDPKSKFVDVIEKLKYVPSSPSSTSSGEVIEEIKPKKKVIVFSEKQKQCLQMMKEGHNVFLTGSAGTGKSLLISSYVKEYQHHRNIAITATTGTAAVLLNGTTLFSYLGIGLGNASSDLLIIQIKKNKFFLKRWNDLDVLIIDEISMMSPELFDKLELVARSIRRNPRPFGGIQLILTGDFFQLPNINQKDMFCFDATSWNDCIGSNVICLNINYRQEDDDLFQKCLSEVRYGTLSDETMAVLKERENVILTNEFGIIPTKIYSLNLNVDEENETQINKLFEKDNNLQFYNYELDYEVFKKVTMLEEKIRKSCNAPFTLELCKGAQVMLLYNMDIESKLVNGSRGIVIGFENDDPIVKFMSGKVRVIPRKVWEIEENNEIVISVSQIPLKLAYATTVHRSQGATIDYAEVDMEGIFEYGQAYVALSRVKSLVGLSIKKFNPLVIKAHPKVIKFYSQLK